MLRQNLSTSKHKPKSRFVVELEDWVRDRYLNLAIFNVILLILVLLRSAGYFEPFFPITINIIYSFGLIMSVFLLGTSYRSSIYLAIFFWIIAAFFRILNIDVWAERAALYSYEALIMGVTLLILRNNPFRTKI